MKKIGLRASWLTLVFYLAAKGKKSSVLDSLRGSPLWGRMGKWMPRRGGPLGLLEGGEQVYITLVM